MKKLLFFLILFAAFGAEAQTLSTRAKLAAMTTATTKTVYYVVESADTTYWKRYPGTYPINKKTILAKGNFFFVQLSAAEIVLPPVIIPPTVYKNASQSFTATCSGGLLGTYTATIEAGAIESTISQLDANNKALASAKQKAELLLVCLPNQPPPTPGKFSPLTVQWMTAAGIPNNDTVFHPGTPQQTTGAQYWTEAEKLAQKAGRIIQQRFPLFFLSAGETERSNKVNLPSPGKFDFVFPNGYNFTPLGLKRGNSSQVATPDGYNLLSQIGETRNLFIAGYSPGTSFVAKAYQNEQWSVRFEDFGGTLYADLPGASNRIITGNDNPGRFEYAAARLSGGLATITRLKNVVLSGNVNGPGGIPNAVFQVGADAPFSFFAFSTTVTPTEADTVQEAVITYLTNLHKNLSPAIEWGGPGAVAVDNDLKLATFRVNDENRSVDAWEASTDGGKTWDPLTEGVNARKNFTGEFGWGQTGVWDYFVSYYIGNRNVKKEDILVRARASNGRLASLPSSADRGTAFEADFDKYKPGPLHYDDRPGSRFRKFVWFTPGFFSEVRETGFQKTDDGGKTWHPLYSMSPSTENKSLAPGLFGIRAVDGTHGHYTEGEWQPDAVLSAPRFNAEPYTAEPLKLLKITGLKHPDATLKATTVGGSNKIILSTSNHGYKVGMNIIVDNNGTGTPGHGARGTLGMINWPLIGFNNWSEAIAAYKANPSKFKPGAYAWILHDDLQGGQWDGLNVRLDPNNAANPWPLFWPRDALKDKSYTGCYLGKVIGVNGAEITVDYAPQVSTTGAGAHYDVCQQINEQTKNVEPFTIIDFPHDGIYEGSDAISLPSVSWLYIQADGFTLKSIQNERMARFTSNNAVALHINDNAGLDSFKIDQGFGYNFSPRIPRNGEAYNRYLMPTTNETFEEPWGGGAFELQTKGGTFRRLAAKNGIGTLIHGLGEDILIDGISFGFDSLMRYDASQGESVYHPGHYWAAQTQGKGIRFRNFTGYSPTFINGIELYLSYNSSFTNGRLTNMFSASNTSAASLMENVNFFIAGNTRNAAYGTGTALQEVNNNFRGTDSTTRLNVFLKVRDSIPLPFIAGTNVYPNGFNLTGTLGGIFLDSCSYIRGDISEIQPVWSGHAVYGKGYNLHIRDFVAKGNYGPGTRLEHISQERPSSISIYTEGEGIPEGLVLENVKAPVIYAPYGPAYKNVIGTQVGFVPYPTATLKATSGADGKFTLAISLKDTAGASTQSLSFNTEGVPSFLNAPAGKGITPGEITYTGYGLSNPVTTEVKTTNGKALPAGEYRFRVEYRSTTGMQGHAYLSAIYSPQPPPLVKGSFIDVLIKGMEDPIVILGKFPLGSNEYDAYLKKDSSKWVGAFDRKGPTEIRTAAFDKNLPYHGKENLVFAEPKMILPGVIDTRFPSVLEKGDSIQLWALDADENDPHINHFGDKDEELLIKNAKILDRIGGPGLSHYDFNVRPDGNGFSAYYVSDKTGPTSTKIRAMVSPNLYRWTELYPTENYSTYSGHIWDYAGVAGFNSKEDADPCQYNNRFDGKKYLTFGGWDGFVQRLGIVERFAVDDPDPAKRGKAKTIPYILRSPQHPEELTYNLPRIFNPIIFDYDATHVIVIWSKNSDASGDKGGSTNYGPQAWFASRPIDISGTGLALQPKAVQKKAVTKKLKK